jgi:hypothetical protein
MALGIVRCLREVVREAFFVWNQGHNTNKLYTEGPRGKI